MNKFKEREEQINVQLERMGAPFRVETWSKWSTKLCVSLECTKV